MQQPVLETFSSQTGQTGPILYKKKNGSQQAIKLPIINPRMRVARRSFFRAILFRSFSDSYNLNKILDNLSLYHATIRYYLNNADKSYL